ncbi:MAG: acyl carrier protein [Moorea sp. SIO2I5]|nr:acyl carrier protein [Moorena sp. SIO2I5]
MVNLSNKIAQSDQKLEKNNIYNTEKNTKQTRTKSEIQDWLVTYVAQLLEITPDEIEIDIPFDGYSLDSATAVGLSGDLEEWLGCEFEPTLLYDYPTIETLAKYLAEEDQIQK